MDLVKNAAAAVGVGSKTALWKPFKKRVTQADVAKSENIERK